MGSMKAWIITMPLMSACGAILYFAWPTEDRMMLFLFGYLFGAPLGGLFLRVLFKDVLKKQKETSIGGAYGEKEIRPLQSAKS